MLVGQTSSSISRKELFCKFSEAEVLQTIFPQITSLPCLIPSPLREDKHPSFSIYVTDNLHIRYKDHSTGERGSLLDLLCKYWKCSLEEAIEKAYKKVYKLNPNGQLEIRQGTIRLQTCKESRLLTDVQVTTRPWKNHDIQYWQSYGISKPWLKYAEIYPISYKIITRHQTPEDEGQTYIFPADKYAYCFVERKEGDIQLKIYQPFSKTFKWYSKMDNSVIGLWTKIPEFGDRVVICSSLKDALCISCQLHIPAICLQGEAYGMSETAIQELRRRYKHIFISFDTDEPGKKDSIKLAEKTGFQNIIPYLGTEKDFSDAFKKYGKEWFTQNIAPAFSIEPAASLQETSVINP